MANWFLSCFLWKCLEASVPPIILGIESLVLSVFGTTTSLTVNLTVVIRIARQNMGMNLRRLPNNSKSSHQKRLAYVITCGWFQHVSDDYHRNKDHNQIKKTLLQTSDLVFTSGISGFFDVWWHWRVGDPIISPSYSSYGWLFPVISHYTSFYVMSICL